MRTCRRCKEKKDASEFYVLDSGIDRKCKDCRKELTKEWYSKTRETRTEYAKRYREENPDYLKTWREKHPGYHKEYSKKWRESKKIK